MPKTCCVPYCWSSSRRAKNVSFHEFPSNIPLRELWLKNVGRADWLPNDNHRICSLHFKDSDFCDGLKIRRLVMGTVPTVFPNYPKYIQPKIIQESQPKRKRFNKSTDWRSQKMQIKEVAKYDYSSNITDYDLSTPPIIISSPNIIKRCPICVNCNVGNRECTNQLTFPDWKFKPPTSDEVPLMQISVSDAIRFIYELTLDDLIRSGLTTYKSRNGGNPSFKDVFVCKQCGDILSELYCAHMKLKYISDFEAVLTKALNCKNLHPDVKKENSEDLQMEGMDFFEDNVGIDSETQSQDQDPLEENVYEKHYNTIECYEPAPADTINSSIESSKVPGIKFLPVVRLERLKHMQFTGINLKAKPISVNVVEGRIPELTTYQPQYCPLKKTKKEQIEEYVIQKGENQNKLKKGMDINEELPEKLTDLSLEIGKPNITEVKIEPDSMPCVMENHTAKKFACDCGQKFSTDVLLHNHIRDVHNFRHKFRCGICARSFKAQRYLLRHQKTHSDQKHVCGVCGKSFTLYSYLVTHHKCRHPTHVIPKKPKRVSPSRRPIVTLESKIKQSSKAKDSTKKKRSKPNMSMNKSGQDPCSYLCKTCGRTLSSKISFGDHMRLHTGEKPYKCSQPDCEMTFRTSINLKVHKAMEHTKDFPFPCKFEGCDRKFKLSSSLRSHCASQHPRLDKLFICDICGKPFKFKFDLQTHLRTHDDPSSSETQKLNCQHCERKFSAKSELRLHVKVVHTKEVSFQCEECGRCFPNAKTLRNHKRVHSGEKPYKCEQCNKQWISHAGLWWHQKHSHLHNT